MNIIETENSLTIDLGVKFEFSLYEELRNAYQNAAKSIERITLDLRETIYIDSSCLGMLLQMKEFFSAEKEFIHIINCNEHIYHLLCYCKFDTLFTISEKPIFESNHIN